MTRFNEIIIKEYLTYLNSEYNQNDITYNLMLSPGNKIIENMVSIIYRVLKNESDNAISIAMNNIDIDHNSEMYEREAQSASRIAYRDYCMMILESTLTYLLLRPSKEGNELQKYILNTHIDDVIERFDEDISFAQYIISFYIKYLVSKKFLNITEKEEDEAWTKYDCLKNLQTNKGYITLNDLIRNTFMEMYDDINNSYEDEYILCQMLDEFFKTDIRDVYLRQNGIDTSNTGFIMKLKKYMMRIIMSDAYMDLKVMQQLMEENMDVEEEMSFEEIGAMNYIENAAENEEFSLPDDFEVRKEIYLHCHFYNSDSEIDRIEDFNSLGESCKTIKITNPLCFFDM